MARPTLIGELARQHGLRGTPNYKTTEPQDVRTLPVVDNTLPVGKNVRTSIDCYVSGQYVQSSGKVIEVKQRYTIFIGYNKETVVATMADVRNRVISDFDARYGGTFNITSIVIPDLPAIPDAPSADPEQMYQGSGLWRREVIPPYEKERLEISTEKIRATVNIKNIRERYRMARNDDDRYSYRR